MSILENGQVAALLSVQRQAISHRQLLAAGITESQLRWAVGRELEVAEPNVFVQRGSATSWEQQLWIRRLRLGPVAAIAEEAAAGVHGFDTFSKGAVIFVVPHGHSPRIAGVRQSRDPWAESVELYENLPVTSPAQTLCDLARKMRKVRMRDVLDDAFARKILTPLDMVDHYDANRRQGKRGFVDLGDVLDDWRDGGKVPARSTLERKTLALFDRFGGPKPVVGWAFPSRTEVPHIADFGDPEALLVLETDGRRWHDRRKQEKRDKERDANAARNGIQVIRILWEHVTGDPKGTWELYTETRVMRLRQLGKAA